MPRRPFREPLPVDTVRHDPAAVAEAGLRNHHIANTAYPIAHERTFGPYRVPRAGHADVVRSAWEGLDEIGLYVHVPFCETRCSFCEYTVVGSSEKGDDAVRAYGDALLSEFALWDQTIGLGSRRIAGLDVGGGTPSFVPSTEVARILDVVRARMSFAPDADVSIETTPAIAAAEPDKLRDYRAMGIERISMGIQVLQPDLLRVLRRGANGAEHLRSAGFSRKRHERKLLTAKRISAGIRPEPSPAMRFQRASFASMWCILSLAAPGAAFGQAVESDADSMAKARAYYYEAKRHEEAAGYVGAAEAYLKAYELHRDAESYCSAGVIMQRANNTRLALSRFKKCLKEDLNGRVADAAKHVIGSLRPQVGVEPESRAEEGSEANSEAAPAEPTAPSEPAARVGTTADDTLRWAGALTAGVGVVSLGVGVCCGLDASSAESEVEALCDESRFDADLADQRGSSATLFDALSGIGVDAISGGGVMCFLGQRDAEDKEAQRDGEVTLSFTPSLMDTSSGLWCTGRF